MNTGISKGRAMKINRMGRALLLSSVAGAALSSGVAFAQCSLAAWQSTAGNAGNPGQSELGNPRYVGECGFEPSAAQQYVRDDITEAAVTEYHVAFYALTKFANGSTSSNTVTVFEALTGSTEVLDLTIRGNNTAVLTSGANTTSPVTLNTGINYNGWNHYYISWTSGGTARLEVNGNDSTAVSTTGATAANGLTEARLGHVASSTPNLQAGGLAVDQFESYRTEVPETAPLCPGDANDDDFRNVQDALAAFNDGNVVIAGQPDFNGDGFINVQDALGIFNNQGGCPQSQ